MMRRLITSRGDTVADTGVTDFVLLRSRGRAAVPYLVSLILRLLICAYVAALGNPPVAAMLALIGFAGLLAVVTTLTSPPPVVTAGGLRLRSLAVSGSLTDVPWDDVRDAWIGYYGSMRTLIVLTTKRDRPYFASIPRGTIDAAEVAAAVYERSGGRVTVADAPPPRPQGGGLAAGIGSYGRPAPVSPLVAYLPWVALLVVLPWVLHAAQPWDRPWWPGNH